MPACVDRQAAGVTGLDKMVDDPGFATAVGLALCGAGGEYLPLGGEVCRRRRIGFRQGSQPAETVSG